MNVCCMILCVGILISLGLVIWILVKQHDCCKDGGKSASGVGTPPPVTGPCPSGTNMSIGDAGKCQQCFNYYGEDGTWYCDGQCMNQYSWGGGGVGCSKGSVVATTPAECSAPKYCQQDF